MPLVSVLIWRSVGVRPGFALPGSGYEWDAAWNLTTTSLGIRPRSATSMPCDRAHSRTSWLLLVGQPGAGDERQDGQRGAGGVQRVGRGSAGGDQPDAPGGPQHRRQRGGAALYLCVGGVGQAWVGCRGGVGEPVVGAEVAVEDGQDAC